MLIKLYRVIKASIGIERVFELASQERYQEGLKKLETIENILHGKDEGFHMLKSLLLLRTEGYKESIANGEIALDLIECNDKFNASERAYLKTYVRLLCWQSYKHLGKVHKAECLYQNCMDKSVGINLSHVADRWKKKFPLAIDGEFREFRGHNT